MFNWSRADRSPLAEWWWTVDRMLLAAIVALAMLGIVLSMAASPPVAVRLGLEQFHFVKRQALMLVPALAVMVSVSLLDERGIRRLALIAFCGGMLAMLYALGFGEEIKGAKRWIEIAGFSLQPSEFAKPAFVVLAAWLFAQGTERREVPGAALSAILMCLFASLLVLQPDFGQTLLISLVWGALFFIAGMPWLWIGVLGAAGVGGMVAAYKLVPHVTARVDRFWDRDSGDTYQVDQALESFMRGGWFGQGPGEGTVKRALPDSHTDFIFAVTAEEYGAIACLILLAIFAFIVLRVLARAGRAQDPFVRLAASGLIIMFGLQAFINMAVNLALMPAKGMTLPFVSTGGSSLLSMGLAMGMVLGLTRRRPVRDAAMSFAPLVRAGRPAG